MLRKYVSVSLIFSLAAAFSAARLVAQESPSIRVPAGNGKPILTDGIFSPDEWDDALKIEVRPNIHLLLKKSAGFVFLGIRYIPFPLSIEQREGNVYFGG